MNEPPGARARVALSALTIAEQFAMKKVKTYAFRRQHLPIHTSGLGIGPSWSYPAVGYQPTLGTEMGMLKSVFC